MKLKRLKAFGFKTFAEPTTLDFEGGITAVVGPNGSGKSNLVDAFRWVLGEQSSRSLRSGKMEEVIFAGNDKRKPLGLAEVSVTFDNTDGKLPTEYTEVEITRRAYRAGEVEYYVNRNHVRLRDIMDLLMGTGLGPGSYAIVSQGQIDAILSSKPSDRRALFEETAGINKFLARKNESLRRLEQTEQNAIRINDLIAELERRIPELETQVRRAKRYRKLSTLVRDLEILSYLRASASRRSERERLRVELERNEEIRSAGAARVASLSANLSALRTRIYQHELALEELRSGGQTQRAELASRDAEYAGAIARRETLEAQNTVISQDVARVRQERETLATTISELDRRIAPLQAEVESARKRELGAQTELSQARAQLDQIFTKLREVESVAAERAARKAERRAQGENARAETERLEAEVQAVRERAERLEIAAGGAAHKYSQREEQLTTLEAQWLGLRAQVEEAERLVWQTAQQFTRAQASHRDYLSEFSGTQSRLHTIEELEASLEGHVPGTRAVVEAWQRGELGGIEGVVSNLIDVDERYARAMDIAFGARLSDIITNRSEDAESAIEFLNNKELGRATFLPLDALQNRPGRELTPELGNTLGVIGYAHTLIRTKPEYQRVITFLIGNVLVVDTLQTGIALVRGKGLRDTVVTLSGEQITGGGAITGGRYRRERSILSRRVQAKTLREQLSAMRENLTLLENTVLADGAASEKAIVDRDARKESYARAEVVLTEVRAEMANLCADVERMQADFEEAQQRADELQIKSNQAQTRERELEADDRAEAHVDDERLALEKQLAQAREQIGQAERIQSEDAARAGSLRERHAALGAQRDGARARLGIIDADTQRACAARQAMIAEIESLGSRIEQADATLEALRSRVREADLRFDAARKEREAFSIRITAGEGEVRTAEIAEREAAAGGEVDRTRLAEIEAELGMLVSQFAQNPATEEECAGVEVRYAQELDEVTVQLPRLREDLARLSNVNLNAQADRDELIERERFLREQLEDLAKARETLLSVIREIEQSTQVKFNEVFNAVAAAFNETYARLFLGGEAKMWQTNPENLSESGIELSVQPPGKKMMALPALSGGERAMTAAALIFALIKVRPSPFYLLDEVDAALDDINVERFSNMVRELAGDSQMIIVTHNKKTMELADRLYGLTMGEPGVSTIISAVLSEREEEREPAIA